MFRRILVPLDGSALAEIALGPASVLARRFDAQLLLVSSASARSLSGLRSRSAQARAMRQASAYLETAANLLQGAGHRVEIASPADTLLGGITQQRQFQDLDLVVVARGQSGLDGVLHLSTGWGGLVQSTVPILVLKGAINDDQSQRPPRLARFMTCPEAPILVPLDGSALAESALPVSQELARAFENPLLLCRAARQPYVAGNTPDFLAILAKVQSWASEEALNYLRQKQEELARTGLEVQVESHFGTPAECIEACVQHFNPGLIVIAVHGRSGLGRLISGGTVESALSQDHVPILLARVARPQLHGAHSSRQSQPPARQIAPCKDRETYASDHSERYQA